MSKITQASERERHVTLQHHATVKVGIRQKMQIIFTASSKNVESIG
jgi:hypothetical protein